MSQNTNWSANFHNRSNLVIYSMYSCDSREHNISWWKSSTRKGTEHSTISTTSTTDVLSQYLYILLVNKKELYYSLEYLFCLSKFTSEHLLFNCNPGQQNSLQTCFDSYRSLRKSACALLLFCILNAIEK